MKQAKKVLSVMLVFVMALVFSGVTAFAASITIDQHDSANPGTNKTEYTWYQILVADISADGSKVAYYVETQEKADALEGTGLFTATKAMSGDRWYLELTDSSTDGETIATALEGIKSSFEKTGTFKMDGTTAKAEDLDPGYYLVTSTLGTKVAVQTLKDVEITEKNEYPSVTISIDKESASIGEDVTYTVTVTVPATVAEKEIKIVDKLDSALTKDNAVTGLGDGVAFEGNTVTIPAATVSANKGGTITFTYKAKVNDNAKVNTAMNNSVVLKYDKYESAETDVVTVKTYGFQFQKIEEKAEEGGDATVLEDAKFSLWTAAEGGERIYVKKNAEGVYRVDVTKEGEESDDILAGLASVEGLAEGTYYLQEDEAPAGYNRLSERKAIVVNAGTSSEAVDLEVENKAGVELPETGALGTQIFYIVGILAILGAGVFMVTNKRIAKETF